MNTAVANDGSSPPESVTWTRDESTGLRSVIVVHNRMRGPAFGGCRMWHYESDQAAELDACRLAEGMSLKNALADLPFGGGKAVIMAPGGVFDRTELFAEFGRSVERLNGSYITAEDVGVTTSDMRVVGTSTHHVSGLPRESGFGGDPSPMTALGVFVSIEAAVLRQLRRRSLAGTRVAVQGLGAVGSELCRLLAAAGCSLVVADVNAERARYVAQSVSAEVVQPDEIVCADVDVYAPCALGAVLNQQSVPLLKASIVAGAANNQLASPADGAQIHSRGILYLPDFLVNAGGIISVAREFLGQTTNAMVRAEVEQIRNRVLELMERCEVQGASTALVAEQWARSKLTSLTTSR